MTKICIIGAGSFFTKDLVTDIVMSRLEGGVIALVDIDARRLSLAVKLVNKLVAKQNSKWEVIGSTDRRQVLPHTDFVINQIEVNGLETVRAEYEIPLKYGVKQCIGDTLGPGGLFKTLRTLPSWFEIVRDIEDLCPSAVILNYTNPMSAVTLATSRVTNLPIVGLCHSIQNTSQQLAEYLDVPYNELHWRAGGINHMSWFVELTHNGKDMYPELKKRIADKDFLAQDPVRFDTMKYFGAFPSESSGHYSEYVPYYRKRQDLIDLHCSTGYNGGTGFYADNWPIWREENDQEIERQTSDDGALTMESSGEYAPVIIEAIVTDTPSVIYGNVVNTGLIDNLSSTGVVEVACLVDSRGVQPTHFGPLPEHLAALCRSNMSFFELAVSAAIHRDREAALQALLIDPLTAAVCSPSEIQAMFDELYDAEKSYIEI